ncbi:MAG: hypothetical protein ACHRHE_10440 [Tepidisphaerales bacterium]
MLAGLSVGGLRTVAGGLVQGSDARAEPMKQALAALVEQIEGGDFDKAKAVYAGDKADVELLKAYVDGVATAKTMRAAMHSKFGDYFKERLPALDTKVARMAVYDHNSVIFLDDPDRAASSADSPLGVGIEFKRVDGKWKVLSLASAPNTAQEHLARLQKYILTVRAITEKTKSGAYRDAKEAEIAADRAEDLLWPITRRPASSTQPTK